MLIETKVGDLEIAFDRPKLGTIFGVAMIVPGWTGNAIKSDHYADMTRQLLENGYGVLRLNPPGHGESSGKLQDFTVSKSAAAILVAARWLQQQRGVDKQRISLVATSIGGSAAIVAAANPGRISFKSLVLTSARSNFAGVPPETYTVRESDQPVINHDLLRDGQGLDFYSLAKNITAPTLVIHGEQDADIAVEQSQRLYAAISTIQSEKKLLLLPGAGHRFCDDDRETAIDETVEWVVAHG